MMNVSANGPSCKLLVARQRRVLTVAILFWFPISACSGFLTVWTTPRVLIASASFVQDLEQTTITSTHPHPNITAELSFFGTLAANVANCLVKSELKRDSGFDGASTGWTSWVEDSSAARLQSCMDKLSLVTPVRAAAQGDVRDT